MYNINIISVYNRPDLFEQMKNSIEATTADKVSYRVIGIDNTKNQFSSIASAYNYAIDNLADGEVLIFCHQDIIFNGNVIEKAYSLCVNQPKRLIGAAGVKEKGERYTVSKIKDPHAQYDTLQGETEPVFTLDEVLVAGNAELFKKMKFNSVLCDNWHFYCVELCLRCNIYKYEVLVFDANIEHLSAGKIDSNFIECKKRIRNEYRSYFRKIPTTCTTIYTSKVDEKIAKICSAFLSSRLYPLYCKTLRPLVKVFYK